MLAVAAVLAVCVLPGERLAAAGALLPGAQVPVRCCGCGVRGVPCGGISRDADLAIRVGPVPVLADDRWVLLDSVDTWVYFWILALIFLQ